MLAVALDGTPFPCFHSYSGPDPIYYGSRSSDWRVRGRRLPGLYRITRRVSARRHWLAEHHRGGAEHRGRTLLKRSLFRFAGQIAPAPAAAALPDPGGHLPD